MIKTMIKTMIKSMIKSTIKTTRDATRTTIADDDIARVMQGESRSSV